MATTHDVLSEIRSDVNGNIEKINVLQNGVIKKIK